MDCLTAREQGSASECVLVTLLAARHAAIGRLKVRLPFVEDGNLLSKLVAYSSKLVSISVFYVYRADFSTDRGWA